MRASIAETDVLKWCDACRQQRPFQCATVMPMKLTYDHTRSVRRGIRLYDFDTTGWWIRVTRTQASEARHVCTQPDWDENWMVVDKWLVRRSGPLLKTHTDLFYYAEYRKLYKKQAGDSLFVEFANWANQVDSTRPRRHRSLFKFWPQNDSVETSENMNLCRLPFKQCIFLWIMPVILAPSHYLAGGGQTDNAVAFERQGRGPESFHRRSTSPLHLFVGRRIIPEEWCTLLFH